MSTSQPELISPEEAPAVRRYLSWHALAAEFMCGIVARGIPLAETREQRRALMHQIRTENTQAAWLVNRVHELGGEVPEQDEELRALQSQLTEICDRSWIAFLACGEVALRGYMSPYIRALSALMSEDEAYEHFSQDVLVPEIAAHFQHALRQLVDTLRAAPDAERPAMFDEARTAERQAFELFRQFIATSYPILEEFGVDTGALETKITEERDRFWDRLRQQVGLPAPSAD